MNNGGKISANTYFKREPDFDGMVLFYGIGSGLMNGWKYSNGKIVGSISQSSEEKYDGGVMSRARTCWTETISNTVKECYQTEWQEYDDEWGWTIVVNNKCDTYTEYEYIEHCTGRDDDENPGYENGGNGSGKDKDKNDNKDDDKDKEPEGEPCPDCFMNPCVCPKETPCNDQAANNSAIVDRNLTYFNWAGLQDFINQYQNHPYEVAVSLIYDYTAGEYYLSNLSTKDDPKSCIIPFEGNSNSVHQSLASIHNHPSSEGFSATDIYGLIDVCRKTEGNHKISYIICANGDIFAAYIQDTGLAYEFMDNYSLDSFKSIFENMYREISLNHFVMGYEDLSVMANYANAYLSRYYHIGVKISKLEDDNFTELDAKREGTGDLTLTKCK